MTLSVQLYTMIAMLLTGVWIGVAVDTYGRLISSSRWTWLVFLSDVLFWIVQALFVFYVLLHVNEGDVRFYIFIALLCGFAAYRALFQNMYRRLLERLLRFACALSRMVQKAVLAIIIKPFQWLSKLILASIIVGGNVLLKGMFLLILPLKWLLGLILQLLPDSVKNRGKRVAGFFQIVQNKTKKWLNKFRR